MNTPRCPRCGGSDVVFERGRRPFGDALECDDCGYVGPAKSKAEPKPRAVAEKSEVKS